jgi:hypothetical protein
MRRQASVVEQSMPTRLGPEVAASWVDERPRSISARSRSVTQYRGAGKALDARDSSANRE